MNKLREKLIKLLAGGESVVLNCGFSVLSEHDPDTVSVVIVPLDKPPSEGIWQKIKPIEWPDK
jgi:hypothetical protein